MKILCFCPIWNIEKTENWLQEMEMNGYRIEKISFFRTVFHFKKAKPRSAQYFFCNVAGKGDTMVSVSLDLLRRCKANEIPMPSSTLTLYRITDGSDLTFEKNTRLIYFRRLALENLAVCCALSLLLFGLALASRTFWLPACTVAVTFPGFCFNLYGFFKMVKKVWSLGKDRGSKS